MQLKTTLYAKGFRKRTHYRDTCQGSHLPDGYVAAVQSERYQRPLSRILFQACAKGVLPGSRFLLYPTTTSHARPVKLWAKGGGGCCDYIVLVESF